MEFTEILALLTAKFSGTRKDVLTNIAKAFAMAASSEEDAKKLVEGLTEDKVAAFSKDFRSGIDREVSNAKTAHEKSLRDKFDFTEKKSDPSDPGKTDPGKGDPNDVSTIVAAAIAKAMEPYKAVIDNFNADKINAARRQKVEEITKDVPEHQRNKMLKDFDRMKFEKDEDFDAYLEDTKADAATIVQDLADKGLSGTGGVSFGAVDKNGVSAGVAAYIKDAAGNDNPLGGKEV